MCHEGTTHLIQPSLCQTQFPLELAQFDISGKITTPSLDGSLYSVGFAEDRTANSDAHFNKKKIDLFNPLKCYKERAEQMSLFRMINISPGAAGENMSRIVSDFCLNNGIRLYLFSAHAHESNSLSERYMQELGFRACVLLFYANLNDALWAADMLHGIWQPNVLPSSHIGGRLPILAWNPREIVSFNNIPKFGEHFIAFLYQSPARPNKKLSTRALDGKFVGLESKATLFRIFVLEAYHIIITRCSNFLIFRNDKFPGVASLLDGISKQSELEINHITERLAEEVLSHAFSAYRTQLVSMLPQVHVVKSQNQPRLHKSFREAIISKLWCEAIDRDFLASFQCNTWNYVNRTPDIMFIPNTWVFMIKPLDNHGESFLHIARCCVCGDMQNPGLNFNHE